MQALEDFQKNSQIQILTDIETPSMNHFSFVFQVTDPNQEVIWPPPSFDSGNLRKDELWRDTCFEVFLKEKFEDFHYWELNFAPSSFWNCYRFSGYRQPHPPQPTNEIELESVDIDLATKRFQFNCFSKIKFKYFSFTAVIKRNGDSAPIYFAIQHSEQKPDFHDPKTFVLKI